MYWVAPWKFVRDMIPRPIQPLAASYQKTRTARLKNVNSVEIRSKRYPMVLLPQWKQKLTWQLRFNIFMNNSRNYFTYL